jgi:MFS family permease
VYRETGSALSVGLMLMATAAPSLVLGLIAGVLVDRWDRKRIMIIADLARAALVLAIPFLISTNIAWLYGIVLLSSVVGQFFDPAHSSIVPETAPDEELAAANSMIAISAFGSTAVGFAASGLIASRFPIEWCFYIDAVTFLVSALMIYLIRVPAGGTDEKTTVAAIFRNLQSGISFLRRTPILFSIFILTPFVVLSFGMWNALLLPFALQVLKATEFEYGLQEGLTSVGFVIGSLLMARVSSRLREGQWITLMLFVMGIIGIIYATLSSIPLAIIFVMISGFANAPYAVARSLIIQRNTPRELRGRVSSTFFVTRDAVFLLGMASAGLADVVGARQMIMVSAWLLLVPAVFALFLPGLAQPAAEWKRALQLLRAAPVTPSAGASQVVTLADFDALAHKLPALAGLSQSNRRKLMAESRVTLAPSGASILRKDEAGDAAYFILSGTAVAGIETESGDYRSLETMRAGDFFGEIAVLTGGARTANVVAAEATRLLQVPAATFRQLIADEQINKLIQGKFSERMARTNLGDLPRLATLDQQASREMRTEAEN